MTSKSMYMYDCVNSGCNDTTQSRPSIESLQTCKLVCDSLRHSRSAFPIHPQLGVTSWINPTNSEQSSSNQFLKKFSLQPEPESSKMPGYAPGLPVYREKNLAAQTHSGTDPKRKDPMIQFSIFYDILLSKLSIQVHHVSDLPKDVRTKGRRDLCDPFVTLQLEPDRSETFQSEIISNSLHPTFNQRFNFGALSYDYIKFQTLVMRIHNRAQSNRVIGKVCLPLCNAQLFGVIMQMKVISAEEMEHNIQGDLLLSLSYNPVTQLLSGTVCKATGLKKQDILGKADPYVRLSAMFKGACVYEWKSSTKYNTLAPVYNEVFSYKVTEEMNVVMGTPGSILLTFHVYDFDKFSQDDMMGVVDIGCDVKSQSGREHWSKVLQSPCQAVRYWHHILGPSPV